MGVRETHYVVAGIKVDFDLFDEEEHEAFYSEGYNDSAFKSGVGNKDGITVISDGMSGEYVIIGKVLAKGAAENGEGISMTDCTLSSREFKKIYADVVSKFPRLTGFAVRVYAFTHYS